MLKRMLIFMIPFAVIGWMVYSGKGGRDPMQRESYERFAKPNEGKIRVAVLELLQNPDGACIATARLPYDSSKTAATCDVCDKLADAGLLDKAVSTVMQDDRPVVAVRYALSAAGRPLYTEALGGRYREPGMCFGTTVVDQLELWTQGTMAYPVVDVHYVPRIENPHAVLHGPHAKALGLPQLETDKATLPMRYACASITPQGDFASGKLDFPYMTVNGVPRCSSG